MKTIIYTINNQKQDIDLQGTLYDLCEASGLTFFELNTLLSDKQQNINGWTRGTFNFFKGNKLNQRVTLQVEKYNGLFQEKLSNKKIVHLKNKGFKS